MGQQEFVKFPSWSLPTDKPPMTIFPILLWSKGAEAVEYTRFFPEARSPTEEAGEGM